MEEQIVKIYEKMKYMKWKSIGVGILTMCTATMLISILEGNPFPHETAEGYYNGWILEKSFLWFQVMIVSVVVESRWQIGAIKALYYPLTALLEEKCDPLALRFYTQYAVNYGINNKGTKAAIYYFEYHLIMALNAMGNFEETLQYLENTWVSKKQWKIKERWKMIARLNIASEKGHVAQYMKIWEELQPAMQKNMEVQAQRLLLQRNYTDAIKMFQMMRGRTKFQQLTVHAGLAECYVKQEKWKEAGEHIEFMVQHGNTTMYKRKGIEMMEEREACE